MHEENFLSSWLREDLIGEEERRKEDKRIREEFNRKRKREGEKRDRTKRWLLKEGVSTLSPLRLFDIFSHGRDSESCGNSWCDLLGDSCGLSDCGSVALSGVLVVTDVPVSPSSAVAMMSEAWLSDSDWNRSSFLSPESVQRSWNPCLVQKTWK